MTVVAVISLGGLASFNLSMDPYAAFGFLRSTKLPQYAGGLGTRIGKAEQICTRTWDILLLGTSRVQMGLDPQHPAFTGKRVYNAGLYGGDFTEIAHAGRVAMERGTKRIILCVDLFSFDAEKMSVPDARQSLLNPAINPIEYNLANLLSINAAEQSLYTAENFLLHHPGDHYPFGLFNDPYLIQRHGRDDWVNQGFYELNISPHARAVRHWRVGAAHLRELADFLDYATRAGIAVDVVQLPMHAIVFERYAAENRWEMYDNWLRDVTKVVDGHNRAWPGSQIEFYDFCLHNALTTEAFPAAGATVTRMKWFWDPLHFKKELGNLVLDELMGQPTVEIAPREKFCEMISGQNIEAHLAGLHRDHDAWVAGNADVQEIGKEIAKNPPVRRDED
jgi:hypothetical protein